VLRLAQKRGWVTRLAQKEASEMAGRQIEFGENQTHKKSYEKALIAISIACIVFVIIAVNTVGGGGGCC